MGCAKQVSCKKTRGDSARPNSCRILQAPVNTGLSVEVCQKFTTRVCRQRPSVGRNSVGSASGNPLASHPEHRSGSRLHQRASRLVPRAATTGDWPPPASSVPSIASQLPAAAAPPPPPRQLRRRRLLRRAGALSTAAGGRRTRRATSGVPSADNQRPAHGRHVAQVVAGHAGRAGSARPAAVGRRTGRCDCGSSCRARGVRCRVCGVSRYGLARVGGAVC